MKNPLTLLSAAGLVTLLTAGSALAYPTTIIGTWVLRANNTQSIAINVGTQGSVGTCPQITGTLGGNLGAQDPIIGYYCPATGQLSFLRNSAGTGATYQVYNGQVSAVSSQLDEQMTGNFLSFGGGAANGAFSFWAQND